MRYQFQVKVIAWVDIILSATVLFFLLLGAFVILTEPDLVLNEIPKEDEDEMAEMSRFMNGSTFKKILLLAPSVCYFVGEIILGIYLLKAAANLNYKGLRTWYVVTITMTVVLAIISIPALLTLVNSGITILFVSWNIAFTAYSVWIVHLLRNEIKANALPGQFVYFGAPPSYQASFSNSNYVYPPTCGTGGNGFMDTKEPMKI